MFVYESRVVGSPDLEVWSYPRHLARSLCTGTRVSHHILVREPPGLAARTGTQRAFYMTRSQAKTLEGTFGIGCDAHPFTPHEPTLRFNRDAGAPYLPLASLLSQYQQSLAGHWCMDLSARVPEDGDDSPWLVYASLYVPDERHPHQTWYRAALLITGGVAPQNDPSALAPPLRFVWNAALCFHSTLQGERLWLSVTPS